MRYRCSRCGNIQRVPFNASPTGCTLFCPMCKMRALHIALAVPRGTVVKA